MVVGSNPVAVTYYNSILKEMCEYKFRIQHKTSYVEIIHKRTKNWNFFKLTLRVAWRVEKRVILGVL